MRVYECPLHFVYCSTTLIIRVMWYWKLTLWGMGHLANSEDPDEMPHKVAFLQSLHCLLRQNLSSEKEI